MLHKVITVLLHKVEIRVSVGRSATKSEYEARRDSPIRADIKKIPRILVRVKVGTPENTISGCAHEFEKLSEVARAFGGRKRKGERAALQRKAEDTYPCLLLSMSRGATARMYVHVQMSRRMTSKRDWKLNSAD